VALVSHNTKTEDTTTPYDRQNKVSVLYGQTVC
jgi:hypothetical protein